jgi:hypothetical protein
MGWTIGVLGFDSRRVVGLSLTTASRTALRPTQPPIQWVLGTVSLRLKRPGREADHSPPSSAEVKECVELYLHSPNTPSWRGAHLKHRDNCTFYLWSHSTWKVHFETEVEEVALILGVCLLFLHHAGNGLLFIHSFIHSFMKKEWTSDEHRAFLQTHLHFGCRLYIDVYLWNFAAGIE